MSNMREALEYARAVLWALLVQNERGDITLSQDMRAQVDQAERLCQDTLDQPEEYS